MNERTDAAGPGPSPAGNHRRAISTTLALFDALLGRLAEWADGREQRGVLYEEVNDLGPDRRRVLRRQVARLRRRLEAARRDLGLAVIHEPASLDIWGRCAAFRENLVELEARRLRRYGEVPPDLADYMDALSGDLTAGLDRLLTALRREARPR